MIRYSKTISALAIPVLALTMTSTARGDAVVYYSATPTGPGASVIAGGTSGSTLELGCNPGLGACTWDVVMHLDTDGGNLSWGTDLSTSDLDISIASPANRAGSPFVVLGTQGPGTPGVTSSLLLNSRGAVAIQGGIPAFAAYELIGFELATASTEGVGSVSEIYAAIDSILWINDEGTGMSVPETVYYGTSSGLPGNVANAVGDEPVITITQVVPEPGTLTLLAIAGVTAIRRRRSR